MESSWHFWSEWILVGATVALVIVGSFQFWMFYRQLKAMHAGLSNTAVSAEAAVTSVNMMRQISVAQLRAYLGITNQQYVERNGQMGIEFMIHNSGGTPAFNVRFKSSVFIGPYPLERELERFDFDQFTGSSYSIFPGVKVGAQESGDGAPGQVQQHLLRQKKHAIYMYVHLVYSDAFGQEHETRACWHSGNVINGDLRHFYAYREGNDAT